MTGIGCQVAGPTICWKPQVVLVIKNPPASAGVPSSIPGLGGSLEEGTAVSPVLLPAEPRGQRSLASYSPWSLRDTIEATQQTRFFYCVFTVSDVVPGGPS